MKKKIILLIFLFLFVISCFAPKIEDPIIDESIHEKYLEISIPVITNVEQSGG